MKHGKRAARPAFHILRWRTQLKAAVTPEAVLDLISRFLDEWKREEIALQPPGAEDRPMAKRPVADEES